MKPISRALVCLLAICLCAPVFAHANQPTYEGPGWDTPEEAVLYYLEGLREQDLGKMIGAYAIETYIDHFDLSALLARMRAYAPTMSPRLPNTGGLVRAINIEERKSEIVRGIFLHMASICMPEQDFFQMTTFAPENADEEIKAFVEGLDNAFDAVDFGTLKVLCFTPPEDISEHYASEQNQENMRRQVAPFGADEARSVIAAFTVDDKLGVLACEAMRYADRWFMFKPHGNIAAMAGLPASGGGMVVVPIEELMALSVDELGAAPMGLGEFIASIVELLGE